MSDWRNFILRRFVPGVSQITAVSDADGLLRDPGVFRALEERGFSVLQFDDSILFRYDYESRFRACLDAGETVEIVVVFKPGELEFETLPSDILARAHQLSFALRDVFPRLSYSIVTQLETVHFEVLFRAQTQYASHPLGEVLTKEFILQHVFSIVPSIVTKESDLLQMLCQKHYGNLVVPEILDAYLVSVLSPRAAFVGWPLGKLIRERAAFWEFLDERWPIFVRKTKGGKSAIKEEPSSLKYSGPELLPFHHEDVRVFIDNFFEDGILTPIPWDWDNAIAETWIRVGLVGRGDQNIDLRFDELGKHVLQECPGKDAPPQAWFAFGYRYAQANLLWTQISEGRRAKYRHQFPELRKFVNEQFLAWLTNGYAGLFNYSIMTPMMVHHIPGYMAYRLRKGAIQRAAFILIDGLSAEQWLVIKEELRTQEIASGFEENALFGWVPSITPISRQAAFSGKIPRYFPESIMAADRDELRWRQFWSDQGMTSREVDFVKVRGDADDSSVFESLDMSRLRALAVTVFKVDRIMHGMQLGTAGMIDQVRMWMKERFLRNLITQLSHNHFEVIISSDHGNLEAVGIGVPRQGVLSDKRGQRCRLYSEEVLFEESLKEISGSQHWEHSGLPDNLYVLLAPYGQAFVQKGARIVCHGGASLEEIVVPFVRLAA
jgi:hypothetical protein